MIYIIVNIKEHDILVITMETKKSETREFGLSQSEYRNIIMFLRNLPLPLYVEKVTPGVIVKDKEGHKVWLKSKRDLRAFKTILKNLFYSYKLTINSSNRNISSVNNSFT